MRRLIEDEDLNLQDLIFILLFFFIIAQTLIVFKVQKDLIVPPKVDKDLEVQVEENKPVITLIIDHRSSVAALAEERENLLAGFEDNEEFEQYCKAIGGREMFLESEREDAHKKLRDKLMEIMKKVGYDKPVIGLIADHRARYGTIFQVNLAIQELLQDQLIDPAIKWKVLISKKGKTIDEEARTMQEILSEQ